MKKNLLKVICIAFIAMLCVGLNAQNSQRTTGQAPTKINQPTTSLLSVDPGNFSPVRGNFTEDVESHPDFAFNSTTNGWSFIDGDGTATYGANSFSFPGMYDPMAYVVMNHATTSPPITDPGAQAHGGTKYFGFWGIQNATNNDWLISPQLSSPTSLSFYAKALMIGTETYPERMKVGYSTTGTAQSDFTIISAGSYVGLTTTWTQYQYDLPAGTKYIAIVCVSYDGWMMMVDDIVIEQGDPGNDCPAVTNVTATLFEANKVIVNWTAPTGKALTEYKIYQGSTEKGTVPVGTTTWTSDVLASGTYTFSVAAVYNDGCNPVRVSATPITIATCDEKVTGVKVDYDAACATATISWTDLNKKTPVAPINNIEYPVIARGETQSTAPSLTGFPTNIAPPKTPNDYIRWTTGVINDALGNSSYPIDMIGVARFLPADYASFNVIAGDKLTKVSFGIQNAVGSSYVIKIYEGTSPTTPGAVKYQQTVTQSLTPNSQNIVTLTTPYVIDITKELWVGVHVTNSSGGYFLSVDAGPVVANKGDIMCWNGEWMTLSGSDFDANWNIEAFISQDNPNVPAAPDPFTANPIGTQLKAQLAWKNPTTTISGGPLSSITKMVLRRGTTVIQEFTSVTPGQEMTFTDETIPSPWQYCYSLQAVNSEGDGYPAKDCANVYAGSCGAKVIVSAVSYGDDYTWSLKNENGVQLLGPSGDVTGGTYFALFDGEAFFKVEVIGSYGDNAGTFTIEVDGEVVHTYQLVPYGYGYGVVDQFTLECETNYTYTYNVYRDDVKIASAIEAATYEDKTFNPAQEHKWSVAVVCKKGGDGPWVSVEKDACSACEKVTGAKAEIGASCTEATLTWTAVAGAKEYKIIRDGVEKTVTAPPYTETGEYLENVTYKWTIATVCDGAESGAVEVSATGCLGINEFGKTISLYPNPASETVNITAANFAKVEVYSSIGQLMVSQNSTTVDVSNYQAGIYFFKVFDTNNNTAMKRVSVIK